MIDEEYTQRLKNTAKYHLGGVLGDALKEAAENIDKLMEYKKLVEFIANDYHELSHDKAYWQRDYWKKRCKKLIEDDHNEQ